MSYMESGPCYQPYRGKNTTKTVQREVPRTSQPAPIQARSTAIGDAPATTSVENFRKENDNEPLDMSHRNLIKKTTPVDVPKEISHVDPKMGKRKGNAPFQAPLHHPPAVPRQTLLLLLMTPPFPKQRTPK